MRVIAGTARSRRLEALPGLDTRPTTDRVKESIFNVIQFDIEGRRVLDLFAGTGQLGVEALSRGALEVARKNVKACGFEGRAACHGRDFFAFLSRAGEKYGLIFLDPPYASGILERALDMIAAIDIVVENGIIVCESPADHALPDLPAPYEKGREYRYGTIKFTLYRRRARP